ncbi:IS5 family transposase [Rufibacter ruber]|uniref:IS5 family transposase n=1 Tax=Rufibacter ruber TaxID=1783499 RepID=UPI000AF00A9C|nr:IS5 family transposase [Rufibacter ruber]
MEAISQDSINEFILPHLSVANTGSKLRVSRGRIVSAILYRLKTGCQWRELPTKEFFDGERLSWQGVYHHFRKWARDGSFRRVWVELLKSKRSLLDLSCVQLDGSQTICKNGGECIGYQGRKAARTCNSLFLADNQGVLLACSPPVSGTRHDLFEIEHVLGQLSGLLEEAGIETAGLFLNADAGFDSQQFRVQCSRLGIEANVPVNPRNGQGGDEYVYFDEELYKRRVVIEQANAWLDSFKALLIRFETRAQHWLALHLLAFTALFIRKFNQNQKL